MHRYIRCISFNTIISERCKKLITMHWLTTILLGVLAIGGLNAEETDDKVEIELLPDIFEETVFAYPPIQLEVYDNNSEDYLHAIGESSRNYGYSLMFNLYQQCVEGTRDFLCNLDDLYEKLQCAIESVGEGEDTCLDGPLSDLDKQFQIILNDFQPGDLPKAPALKALPKAQRKAKQSTVVRPLNTFMVGFESVIDEDVTSVFAMNVGSYLRGWEVIRKSLCETAQQFRNKFLSQIVCAAAKIAHKVYNEETVVRCHASDCVWGNFTTHGNCLVSYCTDYYNGSYCQ